MRVKVEAPCHMSFTKKLFIKITSCQIKHGLFFYLINASSSSSRRPGLDLEILGVACQKVSVQSRAVAHPFGGPPPNIYWAIRALCTCVSTLVCVPIQPQVSKFCPRPHPYYPHLQLCWSPQENGSRERGPHRPAWLRAPRMQENSERTGYRTQVDTSQPQGLLVQ